MEMKRAGGVGGKGAFQFIEIKLCHLTIQA